MFDGYLLNLVVSTLIIKTALSAVHKFHFVVDISVRIHMVRATMSFANPGPSLKNIRVRNQMDWLIKCNGHYSRINDLDPIKTHSKRSGSMYLNPCPWASCQIHKIAGAHAPGMPGTFSPSPQVSDPDMHHGTCVKHVPWCMPGSLTSGFLWNRRRGKTFPAFPAHAQPAILRIW